MRSTPIISLALAATLGLSACSSQNGGLLGMNSNQTLGTGAGAAAGGLAGYLITGGPVGTIVGVAAGALIGNRLSNFLEGDAQAAAAQSAARAAELPTGEKVTWKKTDVLFQTAGSGWAASSGAPFQDSSGRTCRFVHEVATIGDKSQEDTVKLCKGSTGWVPA
jgi:osmotically inducible lipoprotein OsmB